MHRCYDPDRVVRLLLGSKVIELWLILRTTKRCALLVLKDCFNMIIIYVVFIQPHTIKKIYIYFLLNLQFDVNYAHSAVRAIARPLMMVKQVF